MTTRATGANLSLITLEITTKKKYPKQGIERTMYYDRLDGYALITSTLKFSSTEDFKYFGSKARIVYGESPLGDTTFGKEKKITVFSERNVFWLDLDTDSYLLTKLKVGLGRYKEFSWKNVPNFGDKRKREQVLHGIYRSLTKNYSSNEINL